MCFASGQQDGKKASFSICECVNFRLPEQLLDAVRDRAKHGAASAISITANVAFILSQREHRGRFAANREHWSRHDGRDQRLESEAVERKLAFENRVLSGHGAAERAGNGRDEGFRLSETGKFEILYFTRSGNSATRLPYNGGRK